MPITEIVDRPKNTVRWPYFSIAGPAKKHPANLPINANDERRDVWRESMAYLPVL
jgi:hypothetical protein